MKIAIIGSGISGLASANILKEKGHQVIVYEKNSEPGGLIRCTEEDGNLFHRVGGHVFNTKVEKVKQWFWQKFELDKEFIAARRNAKIWIDNRYIGYPIENYLYQLNKDLVSSVISDLLNLNHKNKTTNNFGDFLERNFGSTLYQFYFKPYNTKIWNYDLKKIPLPWLEGKLPMPNLQEIILNNIYRKEEANMVHSSFFYPVKGGSSFIARRLAEGLNINFNTEITEIEKTKIGWLVNGKPFDHIIYTGDIRQLNYLLKNVEKGIYDLSEKLIELPSNGTSNVLCYIDDNNLSWLYIPDSRIRCHRIIYTGNFSPNNNNGKRKTCTIEFSGKVSEKEIRKQIKKLPGNPQPIAFNYEPNSYVIQEFNTRKIIQDLKDKLKPLHLDLVGRFAEWEYYNMDMAILAAMNNSEKF